VANPGRNGRCRCSRNLWHPERHAVIQVERQAGRRQRRRSRRAAERQVTAVFQAERHQADPNETAENAAPRLVADPGRYPAVTQTQTQRKNGAPRQQAGRDPVKTTQASSSNLRQERKRQWQKTAGAGRKRRTNGQAAAVATQAERQNQAGGAATRVNGSRQNGGDPEIQERPGTADPQAAERNENEERRGNENAGNRGNAAAAETVR